MYAKIGYCSIMMNVDWNSKQNDSSSIETLMFAFLLCQTNNSRQILGVISNSFKYTFSHLIRIFISNFPKASKHPRSPIDQMRMSNPIGLAFALSNRC